MPDTPMDEPNTKKGGNAPQADQNRKIKQDPDESEPPKLNHSERAVSNNEPQSRLAKFTQAELSSIYHKWNRRYRLDGLSDNRKHFIDRISVVSVQIKNLILVCKSQASCQDYSSAYQPTEEINNFITKIAIFLMMNEYEIANFVTIVDSIDLLVLGANKHDIGGVLKLALKCLFYAAYYTKVKFGDDDQIRVIRAFTQGFMPNLDAKITQWTLMFLEELDQESFDRNVGQAFMTLEKGFLPGFSLEEELNDRTSLIVKDEHIDNE